MKYLTLIKANIKRQKGSFIGILVMMMIISISISSIISVNINSDARFDEAVEEVGIGDMVCWTLDKNLNEPIENLAEKAEKLEDVEKVENIKSVMARIFVNGTDANNNGNNSFCVYDHKKHPYNVYNDSLNGFVENPPELNAGEIYVPVSYKNKFNCNKGDLVTIKDNNKEYNFKIKGFIEEPFLGAALIGTKQLFITQNDFDKICDDVDKNENSTIYKYNTTNIYQSDKSTLTYKKFESKVNDIFISSTLTLGLSLSKNYTMMFNQIFSAILIAFAVILLIVTLIIISHSISTSIEMDYVNLGILKALGFTKGQLRSVIITQYILSAAIGMLIGIPLSIPVTALVNGILVSVTGLLASSEIVLLPCLTVLFGVFVFVLGFIYFKTRKIIKITPMRAISGGRDSIYFSSRLQMPIHKKCMNFWIALRQLTSNIKQYVGVMLISLILVFFLSMISVIGSWITGNNIKMIFTSLDTDISVKIYDDSISQKDIENIMNKYTTIEEKYKSAMEYFSIDGNRIQTNISSDSLQFKNVIYGRTCKYDNEILVTQLLADELGKNIGDKVTVKFNDTSKEFIISGIIQSANDAGMCVGINSVAAETLGYDIDYLWNEYKLGDTVHNEKIISDINDKYGENENRIKCNDNSQIFRDGFELIYAAVNSLSVLMYFVAVVFVIITVALICGKVVAKEKIDNGILKSLGFTSKKLRVQFALRFLFTAFIGGVVGVVITGFLKNNIMGLMLKSIGLVHFEITQSLFSVVFPVIFIGFMFFALAYLFSRKVRKSDIRCLITE